MRVSWICGLVLVLCAASAAEAQVREGDYERSCRQEVANRFNARKHEVATQNPEERRGYIRVRWSFNQRNGVCEYDNRMNLTRFKEFRQGFDDRDDDRGDGYRDRQPGTNVYPVRADTSGRGTFSGDGRGSIRITRGWVDTTGDPSVSLSGEHNFKITFRGDVVSANGDREFTLRIRSSDRGDANGTATFRLNGDRNEVESITVSGRMNGRQFDGDFCR